MVLFFLVFHSFILFSKDNNYQWNRLSGKWNVINGSAIQSQPKALQWNYYEILNYNTINTISNFDSFNSIIIQSTIFDRIESPSEFLIAFAVTSESQSWFYHMYAFKLTGGFWGLDKISFIYSDRLDKSKPFDAKNNTIVKELAATEYKVKYDKSYNYHIAFENTDVVLYINNEKVLSAPFPKKSHDGRIAISARNVKIAIDKVTVKNREKIIFEDDFNEDSIYVKIMKVKKIPNNEAIPDKKKP